MTVAELREHIPLLSEKPLCDFTPADFRTYVRALYHKREPKRAAGKVAAPTVSWSLTKKGALTVKVRRKPKWIGPAERLALEKETYACAERRIYANEVFLALKRLKIEVLTEEQATERAKRMVGVTK